MFSYYCNGVAKIMGAHLLESCFYCERFEQTFTLQSDSQTEANQMFQREKKGRRGSIFCLNSE